MAHMEHIACLQQGTVAWNQWRERHPRIAVDLRQIRLRSANLTGAYLNDADLSGASLYGVTLAGASLREADLTRGISAMVNSNKRISPKSAGRPRRSRRGGIGVGRAGLDAQAANPIQVVPEPSMGEGNTAVEAPSFRAGRTSTNADLHEADLRAADLTGADLTRADLSKALLSKRLLALKCRSFALPVKGQLPFDWRA